LIRSLSATLIRRFRRPSRAGLRLEGVADTPRRICSPASGALRGAVVGIAVFLAVYGTFRLVLGQMRFSSLDGPAQFVVLISLTVFLGLPLVLIVAVTAWLVRLPYPWLLSPLGLVGTVIGVRLVGDVVRAHAEVTWLLAAVATLATAGSASLMCALLRRRFHRSSPEPDEHSSRTGQADDRRGLRAGHRDQLLGRCEDGLRAGPIPGQRGRHGLAPQHLLRRLVGEPAEAVTFGCSAGRLLDDGGD
jgi:hypothetical protein